MLTNPGQVRMNGGPHPQTASPQTLTDGELEMKQRDSLKHQQDKKGDHKRPCTGNSSMLLSLFTSYHIDEDGMTLANIKAGS